jgi:hypothetical protein
MRTLGLPRFKKAEKFLFANILLFTIIACNSSQNQPKGNNISADKTQSNDNFENKQSNENVIVKKLQLKFGNPLSSEKSSEVSMIYKWKSTEEEFGQKFKYEIDKLINILPYEENTDFGKENGKSIIIDMYRWETPQLFIELIHSFGSTNDNKILSTISVRIDEK